MQEKVNPVAKTFGVLFSILFVFTAVLAILVFNLFNKAFDPGLYKQAISDAGFYEELPVLIGEQINQQARQGPCLEDPATCPELDEASLTSKLPPLPAEQWAAILTPLIDPAWLRFETESVIDQIFQFLNEPGRPLSINISLVELKMRLSGEEGYRAVMQLMSNLPPCTGQDLLKLPASLLDPSAGINLPLCQPGEEILAQAEEPIRSMLQSFIDTIPDETGSLFSGMGSSLGSNLADSLQRVQLVRTIAQLAPVVPLFFLLLVTLLVVRSFKSFLRWWGILLIITGVIGLILALTISPLVKSLVVVRISLEGLAPGLVVMIKDLVMNVAHSIEETLALQNILMGLVGIVMVIVAVILRPKTT